MTRHYTTDSIGADLRRTVSSAAPTRSDPYPSLPTAAVATTTAPAKSGSGHKRTGKIRTFATMAKERARRQQQGPLRSRQPYD